jgi:hypothetical protein
MKWLAGQGADIHARSEDGSTPLHLAVQQGQVASLEWLAEQGVDIYAKSEGGMTALHVAAHSGQIVSLEWLAKQGVDVHAASKNGTTVLHFAADQGQTASLEWLVRQGADVHAKTKNGRTALHYAAYSGQVASLVWLVGQGADVHAKTKDGCTALHLAAQSGQVLVMAWLTERGVSASTDDPKPAGTASPETMSPTIAVVNVDEGYSGLYEKQQRMEGGRVLYKKSTLADGNRVIWYDADEHGGKWCIGQVGNGSMHDSTGWFAIAIDSAISPLNIEATWQELAWEPCSSIRVTKSKKKHTKVIEVKGVPNNLGVGGKYRPQAHIIDGRPTYKGGPDSNQVIWYSASTGSWRIGQAVFAGTSSHFIHAKDTAATPNTVKTPWYVSTAYSLPNPCAKIILPSVEVAEQEVPRQMQLKMPEAMASEQRRCLGCGHQYMSQVEVVYHEECLHHHCTCCMNELSAERPRMCRVCAGRCLVPRSNQLLEKYKLGGGGLRARTRRSRPSNRKGHFEHCKQGDKATRRSPTRCDCNCNCDIGLRH